MVSLKQRQSLATLAGTDPRLQRLQLLLEEQPLAEQEIPQGDKRDELLLAIAAKDASRFKKAAAEIGSRRIASDSDWCQDDYLIFLLLLGNEKFGRPLNFIGKIIDVRRANINPIPRKINEVFAALERQEFGIHGGGLLVIGLLSSLDFGVRRCP